MTTATYAGELSDIEKDPRLQELALRQRKAMTELTARQAQEYVLLAINIRRELDDR